MRTNALVLFLLSERIMFKAVRNYFNEEANKPKKSGKTSKSTKSRKKSEYDETIREGILAINYLISATKRENFDYEKQFEKMHEAFIAITEVEIILAKKNIRCVKDLNMVTEIPNMKEDNALTKYLACMTKHTGDYLECIDKADQPSVYCKFIEACNGAIDLSIACTEENYDFRIHRVLFITDILYVARAAKEFMHYENMQKAYSYFNRIFGWKSL